MFQATLLYIMLNEIFAKEILMVKVSLLDNSEQLFKNEEDKRSVISQIQNEIFYNNRLSNEEIKNTNIIGSIKKKLFKNNTKSSFLTGNDNKDLENTSTTSSKSNSNLKKFIPTSYKLHKYITQNLKQFKGSSYKIQNVSVYPLNGKIYDFYNDVEFIDYGNGIYKDNVSQIIYGKFFKNREELIKNSKISKTGFFVSKDLMENEDDLNVQNSKKLISELFNNFLDLKTFLSKLYITPIDEIILVDDYPLKQNDVVSLCLCKDYDCSKECDEIKKGFRRDLYDV